MAGGGRGGKREKGERKGKKERKRRKKGHHHPICITICITPLALASRTGSRFRGGVSKGVPVVGAQLSVQAFLRSLVASCTSCTSCTSPPALHQVRVVSTFSYISSLVSQLLGAYFGTLSFFFYAFIGTQKLRDQRRDEKADISSLVSQLLGAYDP